MTAEQIEKFKTTFKSIVYWKSEVAKSNDYIRSLSRYDKNGSHEKAILKSIEIRDKHKFKYHELLNGLTYEQWYEKSKKISLIQAKIKRSVSTKDKWIKELEML